MLPWIRPGDVLFILRVAAQQISLGDIVLFAREERLFVHRVVQKRRSDDQLSLVTKGDALAEVDLPLSDNELLGRVAWIDRGPLPGHLKGPLSIAKALICSWAPYYRRFWLACRR
jgi:signal peptidase I